MRKEGYVILVGILLIIIGYVLAINSLLPTRSDELAQQLKVAEFLRTLGLIVTVVGVILLFILPDFSKKSTTIDKP